MKRSPKLTFPPISLRRRGSRHLPEQVAHAIREAIASGALAPASRLPASRVMARMLGVSRNTVLAAYESLTLDGLIAGRVGSGTRVCAESVVVAKLIGAGSNRIQRLRESGFPVNSAASRDPDDHAIYIHN
jgi:GntR family transcriptional regulator / MocR family aminotransferase